MKRVTKIIAAALLTAFFLFAVKHSGYSQTSHKEVEKMTTISPGVADMFDVYHNSTGVSIVTHVDVEWLAFSLLLVDNTGRVIWTSSEKQSTFNIRRADWQRCLGGYLLIYIFEFDESSENFIRRGRDPIDGKESAWIFPTSSQVIPVK